MIELVTFVVGEQGWFPAEPQRCLAPDTRATLIGTYVPAGSSGPQVRISASGADALARARCAAIAVASQVQQGADLLLALGCVIDPEDLVTS